MDRIRTTVDEQLYNHRDELEGEGGGLLLMRAQRLAERLEVLKRKLNMCFEGLPERRRPLSLVENPPPQSGQDLLQNEDDFEHYDPANFLFAEAQAQPSASLLSKMTKAMTPQIVLEQMAAVEADDAPEDFVCPITQCVMVDPVFTSDGNIYERAAITEWFRSFQLRGKVPTSPLTNLELADTTLTPSLDLRKEIQRFMDEAVRKQKAALANARQQSRQQSSAGNDEHLKENNVRQDVSAAYEEPSLRQLTRPSLSNGSDTPTGDGKVEHATTGKKATEKPPTYDTKTIDVGELRRAFQLQQQQNKEENIMPPTLIRSSSLDALLPPPRQARTYIDVDTRTELRNQTALAAILRQQSNAANLNTIFGEAGPQPSNDVTASNHQPIWGSAVVPLHEPNSRVLNLLRVREDLVEGIDDAPVARPLQIIQMGGSMGLTATQTQNVGGGSSTVHLSRTAQRLEAARREAATRSVSGAQRGANVFPSAIYNPPARDGATATSGSFRPPISGLYVNAQRVSAAAVNTIGRENGAPTPAPPRNTTSLNTRVTRRR